MGRRIGNRCFQELRMANKRYYWTILCLHTCERALWIAHHIKKSCMGQIIWEHMFNVITLLNLLTNHPLKAHVKCPVYFSNSPSFLDPIISDRSPFTQCNLTASLHVWAREGNGNKRACENIVNPGRKDAISALCKRFMQEEILREGITIRTVPIIVLFQVG